MKVEQLSPTAQRFFKLIEFDDDEEIVFEIKKHPFGLFVIILTGFFVAAAVLLALGALSVFLKDDALQTGINASSLSPVLIGVGFILFVLIIILMLVAAFIYRSSVVIVTSEKIVQVLYITIFNRKISQLSISDIQDVTVSQKGIFARIFNYGTLVIETAGEQQNYTFTYAPLPYECARAIVGAHERNAAKFGN